MFAIGQSGYQWRLSRRLALGHLTRGAADRNGVGEQLGADLARMQEVAQIAGQTIAHINHRMNGKILCQPARLCETGLELQMPSGQRAPQFTRNEDRVPWLRTGSRPRTFPPHPTPPRPRTHLSPA